ncbi:MAG: T9SS type A sorting domain-containing protein [Bacteroidia bacterium]|nr:T9SS type A sorting domain-containing protein [Bacteroidia bacterium]
MKQLNSYLCVRALLILVLIASNNLKAQTCNTNSLSLLAQYQAPFPALPQKPIADRLNRPYVYVAAKDGGLIVFNTSVITAPTIAHTIGINLFDTLHVMNIHQEGNYLYVALGNFFGTVGSTNVQKPGMAIVDISNPVSPIVKDVWKYNAVERGTSYITVQGNYAYLSAMHKGLMILDITDKNNIVFVSEYQPNLNFPVNNPTSVNMPNARGLAIKNDTVFMCYDAGGLRLIDVTNKNAPFQISEYINNGAINKQQAYNNIELNGNLAYIAVDYCGMEIVNISNPTNITQTGWWNPYNCQALSNIWINSPGHANQIVYNAVDNAVFISAGGSQLRVVNVSNPTLPDSCNGYGVIGTQQGTWGLDMYNNKIYLANITAAIPFNSNWAGLKILDWQSPNSINEYQSNNSILIFNQPNPFYNETEITIQSSINTAAKLSVYSIDGKEIDAMHIDLQKGKNSINWGNNSKITINEGVYFISITTNKNTYRSKIIKIK